MKNDFVAQAVYVSGSAKQSAVGRFQIYRESRGGNFVPGFSTDSDSGAIEAFMLHAPAFEGGDIRVLDLIDRRVIAVVKWKVARTEIGMPVLQRVNIFLDWPLALIACDFLKQKKTHDAVEMRF